MDQPGAAPPQDGTRFDGAVRGYDRRQVDSHLAALEDHVRVLQAEVRDLQRLHREARVRADALESELQGLRGAGEPTPATGTSSGPLADKLLRLAKREAAEIRSAASRDAARMLEQAQAAAELHERQVTRRVAKWAAAVEEGHPVEPAPYRPAPRPRRLDGI